MCNLPRWKYGLKSGMDAFTPDWMYSKLDFFRRLGTRTTILFLYMGVWHGSSRARMVDIDRGHLGAGMHCFKFIYLVLYMCRDKVQNIFPVEPARTWSYFFSVTASNMVTFVMKTIFLDAKKQTLCSGC